MRDASFFYLFYTYTIGAVYEMPKNRDCRYMEIAVPLHPDIKHLKLLNINNKSYENNESNANARLLVL